MKRVFVDTGGFFALITREDPLHDQAVALFTQANSERWSLVTTNAVVFECHALLLTRSRPGRQNAIVFLDLLSQDAYRIERVRKHDEEGAAILLRTHQDKDYLFCDALSFVVMERLGIKEAIAFDRHFREYGRFTIL